MKVWIWIVIIILCLIGIWYNGDNPLGLIVFLLWTVPLLLCDDSAQSLSDFYDSLHVEKLWLSHEAVDWKTGHAIPNLSHAQRQALHIPGNHCSAFIAAACDRLGIYILRPPEHRQWDLANAQSKWLATEEAKANGWYYIGSASSSEAQEQAQCVANQGHVVVACTHGHDSHKYGHAVLVRPCKNELQDKGPTVIMAGILNHNAISLKEAFHSYEAEWPSPFIQFYGNKGGCIKPE